MENELVRVPCKAKVRECTGEHSCQITPDLEAALIRVLDDLKRWKTQDFPLSELIIKDEEEFLVFLSVRREVAERKAALVKDMVKHIVGDTVYAAIEPQDQSDSEQDPEPAKEKKKKKKGHRFRR